MFGKIFESTFYGSMVGAGAHVFAVWSYVISHMKPCSGKKFQVSLNSRVLSAIIGETPERIEQAIEYLSSPDPESRSKEEEGRRLLKVGEYEYIVVNGERYNRIRSAEELRQKNREAVYRYRERKKSSTSLQERQAVKRFADGEEEPTTAIDQ